MGSGKKCFICKVIGLLVFVGALNWGLVGAFNFNLVETVFGMMTTATRAIYGLIGVAALVKLYTCFKSCPGCCKESGGSCH